MGQFVITVANGSNDTERQWTLSCVPDRGGHPTPKAACDRLRSIGGDLEKIRWPSRPCVQNYDPRQVRIVGRWDGEDVNFKQDYTNPSCMAAAAAPIVPDVRV